MTTTPDPDDAPMTVEEIVLEDGRSLIFYAFDDCDAERDG